IRSKHRSFPEKPSRLAARAAPVTIPSQRHYPDDRGRRAAPLPVGFARYGSCPAFREAVRPFLAFVTVLAVLPSTGCWLRPATPPHAGTPAAPVALVTEGSAFTRPDVRDRLAKAVRQLSGRPLLVVPPLDARDDPRRRVAARLAKQTP